MQLEVVAALRCPVEGGRVELDGRVLRCGDGHAFDLARQGYVNLLTGRDPGTGDDAARVEARTRVLEAGRFDAVTGAVADAVATAVDPATPGVVVDLGAGTGHHLAGVLDRAPGRVGVALDLSKHASKRAAQRHPRIGAVVADVWHQLPVATSAAAVVLSIFSPRRAPEIARVLHPSGRLVVVTPTDRHLAGLLGALGPVRVDPRKRERLDRTLGTELTQLGDPVGVRRTWTSDPSEVAALLAMGPTADHVPADELIARAAQLGEHVEVTLDVEVRTYAPGRA